MWRADPHPPDTKGASTPCLFKWICIDAFGISIATKLFQGAERGSRIEVLNVRSCRQEDGNRGRSCSCLPGAAWLVFLRSCNRAGVSEESPRKSIQQVLLESRQRTGQQILLASGKRTGQQVLLASGKRTG